MCVRVVRVLCLFFLSVCSYRCEMWRRWRRRCVLEFGFFVFWFLDFLFLFFCVLEEEEGGGVIFFLFKAPGFFFPASLK